jgi:hypothetical protein
MLAPAGVKHHTIAALPRIAWIGCVDRAEETDKVPFAFVLAVYVRLSSLTVQLESGWKA